MNELLKEALDTQRKIIEIVKFLNEHVDDITEEQEDEIRQKMDELQPELERLDKNNPKFFLN